MKKLEELGISPAPWEIGQYFRDGIRRRNVKSSRGVQDHVADVPSEAEACLIAAAPKLYDCLREAVIEMCADCGNLDNEMSAYQDDFVCHDDECFVKRWRAALAEAAGEGEVSNGK